MLSLSYASAEKCDLIDPIACGLNDCGGSKWSPDESVGYGDNISLKSGTVNMIGSSKVCMKVHGPTLIKFMWKVDPTDQNVWTLSFWDGNSQVKVCKSENWVPVTYSLRGEEDHEISWVFQKYNSYPVGAGAGWIDDLDVSGGAPHFNEPVSQINNSYSNQTISISVSPALNESELITRNTNASVTETAPVIDDSGMSNATPYFEAYVGLKNRSYSSQTIRMDVLPKAENASGWSKNGNERVVASSGISISSSNVTINVPNININVAQLSDVALNISEIASHVVQPGGTEIVVPTKPKDVVVGNCSCPSCNESIRCDHIQHAIDKTDPGGTVFICGGNYDGPIKITKDDITIRGDANLSTKIIGTGQIISVLADNVSIRDVSVMGDNNRGTIGIYASNAPHFKLIHSSIINCSTGVDIANSGDIYIGWTNITSGNRSDTCACSAENRHAIKNYNIGIYLENVVRANISEHNNLTIYGKTGNDGNNVGILWNNKRMNPGYNMSDILKIYSNSLINGTKSCYRFLDYNNLPNKGGIEEFQ